MPSAGLTTDIKYRLRSAPPLPVIAASLSCYTQPLRQLSQAPGQSLSFFVFFRGRTRGAHMPTTAHNVSTHACWESLRAGYAYTLLGRWLIL